MSYAFGVVNKYGEIKPREPSHKRAYLKPRRRAFG